MNPSLIETWRSIIVRGDRKSCALFEHGTCVVLTEPQPDLSAQAVELLRKHGPVRVATPAGDFGVVHLTDPPGWLVEYDHPDILNYVSPEEVASEVKEPADGDKFTRDVEIGIVGRRKRHQDSQDLKVVHVEDKRL
jgi:hypothetical protein